MNEFDSSLPETTTYWIEDGLFRIKHTGFKVTEEEGAAVAQLLVYGVKEPTTRAMVIDNREAPGMWTPEIEKLMDNHVAKAIGDHVKKTVTLTNSNVAAMQINGSARDNENQHVSRAFYCDFNEEVLEFIDEKEEV